MWRHKYTDTDTQTYRQTDTDTQTDRQTDRHRHRHRHKHRHRHRYRHRHTSLHHWLVEDALNLYGPSLVLNDEVVERKFGTKASQVSGVLESQFITCV